MRKNSAAWACIVAFLVGAVGISAQTFDVIHTFSPSGSPFPFGRLLVISNSVYGINGGGSDSGSVFRVNTDGSGYKVLKHFSLTYSSPYGATNLDGATPLAGLVLGEDTLYGSASQGGMWGKGTLFSLKTDGTDFTVLRHFAGSDGKAPYGELFLANNVLYATTAGGGDFGKGAVFRLNTDGSDFALLKSFAVSDGMLPLSGLTLSDGVLYGTTYQGGDWGYGTVFSLRTDGSGFTTLKHFAGVDGASPRYNLIVSGAAIYGTTEGGIYQTKSLVYRLNTNGADYSILKTFPEPDPVSGTNDDGYYVRSGLAAVGGTLFGTTSWGGQFGSGVVFALRMDGSGYTVLRHFSLTTNSLGGYFTNPDGAEPLPSLAISGGTLYGTTQQGGSTGGGTLFSLNIAPHIQLKDGNFGVRSNAFGFSVTGYSNQVLIIEACTDLTTSSWLSLQTNTVTTGPVGYVDSSWTEHPQRLYRVRMQ